LLQLLAHLLLFDVGFIRSALRCLSAHLPQFAPRGFVALIRSLRESRHLSIAVNSIATLSNGTWQSVSSPGVDHPPDLPGLHSGLLPAFRELLDAKGLVDITPGG
jgi:hypothetical protein